MNKYFIITFIIISSGLLTVCQAQSNEVEVKAKGVFGEIDVERHNNAIEVLQSSDKEKRNEMVESIRNNPDYYNPPVIYALSNVLFDDNKEDEAMYWFYLGQLRARYDANLCRDISAKQAVSILNNQYGSKINQYAFKDIEKLEKVVKEVVDYVRLNDEDYDNRWINLHGMWAILAGLDENHEVEELSLPIEEWETVKIKTVDDYYNGFLEYVKSNGK